MTTTRVWVLGAPVLLGALAGCESVSDGEEPVERPSFEEMLDEGTALYVEFDDSDYTDPSTLPTEGRATYEGVIGLETSGSSGAPGVMLGKLSLGLDWESDDPLTGEATSFVSQGGEEMEGSLEIGDGGLDRDVDPDGGGWTFVGEMEGTLTDQDSNDFDYSGAILGDFFGEDPDHASGVTDGLVTGPNGNGTFEGDFVAARD